jgi:large conductance mechanosensitive channel
MTDFFQDFINFLSKRNVINTGIGLIIGNQIRIITEIFVKNVINPIVNNSLPKNVKLEKIELKIFNINFKIGEIINKILEFLIIMFIIYNIFQLQKTLENSKSIWNLFGIFKKK